MDIRPLSDKEIKERRRTRTAVADVTITSDSAVATEARAEAGVVEAEPVDPNPTLRVPTKREVWEEGRKRVLGSIIADANFEGFLIHIRTNYPNVFGHLSAEEIKRLAVDIYSEKIADATDRAFATIGKDAAQPIDGKW